MSPDRIDEALFARFQQSSADTTAVQTAFDAVTNSTDNTGMLRNDPCHVLYDARSEAQLSMLELATVCILLKRLAAIGHTIGIVTTHKNSAVLQFLQSSVPPQHVTSYDADGLERRLSIDSVFAGLETLQLHELLGESSLRSQKNTTFSIAPILAQGKDVAVWRQVHADVVLRWQTNNNAIHFATPQTTENFGHIPALFTLQPLVPTTVPPATGANEHEALFAAIMAIPDELLMRAFTVLTCIQHDNELAIKTLVQQHPLEAKKQLATVAVAIMDGDLQAGIEARKQFESRMARTIHTALPIPHAATLFDALATAGIGTKTEIRRLFTDGAIQLINQNSRQRLQPDMTGLSDGAVIKAGKKHVFKVVAV